MSTRTLIPLAGALALAACATDELELEVTSSEVAGTLVVRRDDGNPATTDDCLPTDVTDANVVRFRTALATDLLPKAFAVSRSPAFRQCLRDTITAGQVLSVRRWNSPPNGVNQQFGPYSPWVSDRGRPATQSMPLARMRELYASRIVSDARSPHDLTITCIHRTGGAASDPSPIGDRARTEAIFISKDFFNQDPSLPGFRAFTMAVVWHELIHERGYDHPIFEQVPLDVYNDRLPPIVGACMEEVFAQSESVCGFAPCAGGMRVVDHLWTDGGGCQCIPDQPTAALVDSWDWPGLTKVAVNSAGDGYVLAWNGAKQSVFERAGHTWTAIGTATAMVAGGDAVAMRQTGPGFPVALNYWRIKSRTGVIETANVSGADGPATMDGFGALVRTTGGRAQRRIANGSWQDLGPAETVAAGSDLLFKRSGADGFRLDPATTTWTPIGGVSPGQLAVDSYGTLHGVSTSLVSSRFRGASWDLIGFDHTAVGVGDNLFVRSTNGWVYRQAPAVGWQAVAPCDSFAVGGRSMYCVRGTRLELYEY